MNRINRPWFALNSEELEIDLGWVVIAPPELWLFLPGVWIYFEFLSQGGFWVNVTDPSNIGGNGPRLMFQGGIVGNNSWQWRDER